MDFKIEKLTLTCEVIKLPKDEDEAEGILSRYTWTAQDDEDFDGTYDYALIFCQELAVAINKKQYKKARNK